MRPEDPTRRAALLGLVVLPACVGAEDAPGGAPDQGSDAAICGPAPAPGTEALTLALADYPALREPGGAVVVERPDLLLNVVVVHTPEGCFRALWRICPHGACPVAYRPDDRDLRCPCHGSRFGENGALLMGPAERGLRAFPVTRAGETLTLYR